MNPNERQRLKLLAVLLAVLGVTVWIGSEIYRVPEPAASSRPDLGPSNLSGAAPPGGTVQIENLERPSRSIREDRRNPFQYGPEPLPDPVPTFVELPRESPGVPVPPPAGLSPPTPPPPPPIGFRYSGFATAGAAGEPIGLLSSDGEMFTVFQDDVVMGRYRVNSLNEAFVEIEDLELPRTERIPLVVP